MRLKMAVRTILAAAAMLAAESEAGSIQMSWPGGARNLSLSSASLCTLIVRAPTLADVPTGGWRVVWRGYGAGAEPIRLISAVSGAGTLQPCGLARMADLASHIAFVDSATFCRSAASAGSVEIRYVLAVKQGVVARFALLSMDGGFIGTGAGSGPVAGVTLNGTPTGTYSPVLASCQVARKDEMVRLRATGAFLDSVRWARYRLPEGITIPCRLDSVSSASLIASFPLRSCLRAGVLEVGTAARDRGAVVVQGEDPLDPACTRWQALVVRFRSGALDPAAGSVGGAVSSFTAPNRRVLDLLQGAGVASLWRLYPGFHHEDVHTTNLLGEPIELVDLADIYVATLSPGVEFSAAEQALRSSPDVVYAEHESALGEGFDPNDPLFSQQWGLRNTGTQVCGAETYPYVDIGLFSPTHLPVWDATTGQGIRIGILDSGLDFYHEELPGQPPYTPHLNFVPGAINRSDVWDDSEEKHGTAVSGIAAATMNNGLGIAGTAPQAELWIAKVLDYTVHGETDSITEAIEWTTGYHLPVVNLSLGFQRSTAPGGRR